MLFKTCGVYPFNPKAIQVSNNDNSEVAASEGNGDKGNSDNTVENDKDEVEQSFNNIVENDTDKVVHEQPSPNVNLLLNNSSCLNTALRRDIMYL